MQLDFGSAIVFLIPYFQTNYKIEIKAGVGHVSHGMSI